MSLGAAAWKMAPKPVPPPGVHTLRHPSTVGVMGFIPVGQAISDDTVDFIWVGLT